jgi:hypothetical protein
MKKKMYKRAIDYLTQELVKLGGAVFARYIMQKNDESRKTVESLEFMNRLFSGDFKTEEKDYLKEYLEPLWEINSAINKLNEFDDEEEKNETSEKDTI